jgi:hypothetical protein
MSADFAAAGMPGVVRPARRVAQPHVQIAFLHLNLTYET